MSHGLQNIYPTYLKIPNAHDKLFILKYFWSQLVFSALDHRTTYGREGER